MKKSVLIIASLSAIALVGCASLGPSRQRGAKVENTAGAQPLTPYSGPKARVTVADFEVKAAKAGGEAGTGLREMLVTALTNSNRFSVVERQAVGAAADLIITAAVAEFEPQSSGGRSGIGGGGGAGSGVLGGLLSTSSNKAHMALDIRIVDASTSQILAGSRVQGQAADISGITGAGSLGGWGLVGGLSAYANTPMENAIRACIIEAVRYISQAMPANFYKY